MNKLVITCISCVAAISLFVVGCATPTQTQNAQLAVTAAAQLGSYVYLSKHTNDISQAVAVEQILTDISVSTNLLDAATVNDAIVLSGKQNSPVIALVAADAINIGNIYIQNNSASTNILAKSQSVKAVCGWVATGIGQGVTLLGK